MQKHEWDVPGVGFILGLTSLYGIGVSLMFTPFFWAGEACCVLGLGLGLARYATKLGNTWRRKPGRLPPSEALLVSGLLLLGLAFSLWTTLDHLVAPDAELALSRGTLEPANDPSPTPPAGCTPPDGAIRVYFGKNLAWLMQSPFTLVATPDDVLLQATRSDNGRGATLTLLKIFDDRDNNLVHVGGNDFWLSPSVRFERPDRHTLIIFDHLDKEVLYLRYLNPSAFFVRGEFRHPHGGSITVSNDKLTTVQDGFHLSMSQNCIRGDGVTALRVP